MGTIQYSLNNTCNDIFSNRSIHLNTNIKSLPNHNSNLYNGNLYNGNLYNGNLNNSNLYNGNLKSGNGNLKNGNLKNGNLKNGNLKNGNDNLYNKFDNHCIETYGKRTCVLFYTNNEKIQIRLLDSYTYKYFEDTEMYIIIPELLEKLYTVVVVDKIKKTNSYEITAIHIPNR